MKSVFELDEGSEAGFSLVGGVEEETVFGSKLLVLFVSFSVSDS